MYTGASRTFESWLTACESDDTVDAMRIRVDKLSDVSDGCCSDEAGVLTTRNWTVTQLSASSIATISSLWIDTHKRAVTVLCT